MGGLVAPDLPRAQGGSQDSGVQVEDSLAPKIASVTKDRQDHTQSPLQGRAHRVATLGRTLYLYFSDISLGN